MTKEASAGVKRVPEIREAKVGKGHPLVAEAVARCGRAEVASGRCEEGAEQVERGYQLLAKRFGTSSPRSTCGWPRLTPTCCEGRTAK